MNTTVIGEPPAACPFCGWTDSRTLARQVRASEHALRRCRECELEYLWPAPTWDEIQRIYTAGYYRSWGMAEGETPEVAEMKKATFALRMEEISRYVRPGRVLDVGTASGFFLEVAEQFGFEPFGVELSEYSGALARRKFGEENIWIGTLETAPFERDSFQLIAMSDLLEHVPDPVRTLERARELLAPGGVLMVMTPNTRSLTHRLMGIAWTHYKLEHLTYWSPAVIRRAAAQTGFRLLSIRPAWKVMTLAYLATQFEAYPHPILTPLVRLLNARLAPWRHSHFRLSMGEMVALLRREDESV
jgi:2-polyprenyl-3-methyl-5-hydroxy-6-metoxy-1,4-benzoquinol methylase